MEVTRDEILRASRALAGVCDGAQARDESGYNKLDAPVVLSILRAPRQSDRQVRKLWKILRKYKGQLEKFGIDYDSLVAPDLVAASGELGLITLGWAETQYGTRIEIRFEYDRHLVDLVRSQPKRWWDPARKVWYVPEDLESFDALVASLNGRSVQIPEQMQEHFRLERERRAASMQMSRADNADIEVPTRLPLFPFQRAGVQFIEQHNGRVLLSDSVGLGKSAQILGFLIRDRAARLPALVVVPNSIKINWCRETEKFTDLKPLVLSSKTGMRGLERAGVPVATAPTSGHDVVIVNYDIVDRARGALEAFGFKTLILDEAQAVKEQDARRSKVCLALSQRIPNVIAATGTPIMNRPREVWHIVKCVDSSVWPNFLKFAKRYCAARQETIHTRSGPRAVWDFSGSSNLEELDRVLRGRVMIRREKKQVLKELPPITRTTIPLSMNGGTSEYDAVAKEVLSKLAEQKRELTEWKERLRAMPAEEARAYLAGHAEQAARMSKLKGFMIDEIEKVKQAAVRAKMAQAVEFLCGLVEQAGKTIIFVHHHETIDSLVGAFRGLGYETVKVDGRDPAHKRQEALDAFQQGTAQVAVLGIMAASTGLTLTASSTVAIMELPWRPSDLEQATGRVHRISQQEAVNEYVLVACGTLEEKIAGVLDAKREVVNSAVGEGDRTLEEQGILDAILDEMLG